MTKEQAINLICGKFQGHERDGILQWIGRLQPKKEKSEYKYSGYLESHINEIMKSLKEGKSPTEIAKHLYNNGVRSSTYWDSDKDWHVQAISGNIRSIAKQTGYYTAQDKKSLMEYYAARRDHAVVLHREGLSLKAISARMSVTPSRVSYILFFERMREKQKKADKEQTLCQI
jgi:hypothetical protein